MDVVEDDDSNDDGKDDGNDEGNKDDEPDNGNAQGYDYTMWPLQICGVFHFIAFQEYREQDYTTRYHKFNTRQDGQHEIEQYS